MDLVPGKKALITVVMAVLLWGAVTFFGISMDDVMKYMSFGTKVIDVVK